MPRPTGPLSPAEKRAMEVEAEIARRVAREYANAGVDYDTARAAVEEDMDRERHQWLHGKPEGSTA